MVMTVKTAKCKKEKATGDIIRRVVNGKTEKFKVLFSSSQIKRGTRKVVGQIYEYCQKHNLKQIVFLEIAKGGQYFATDLSRALWRMIRRQPKDKQFVIEIIELDACLKKSYIGTKCSPIRTITHWPDFDFSNNTVFVIDNLLTTGLTMQAVIDKLNKYHNTKIKTVVSIKTSNDLIKPDFWALKYSGDKFLYGYGLDFDERLRSDRLIYYPSTR